MPIDAGLVLRLTREMQDIDPGEQRAQELAHELEGLLQSVRVASSQAGFDDEPGGFLRALWSLRER